MISWLLTNHPLLVTVCTNPMTQHLPHHRFEFVYLKISLPPLDFRRSSLLNIFSDVLYLRFFSSPYPTFSTKKKVYRLLSNNIRLPFLVVCVKKEVYVQTTRGSDSVRDSCVSTSSEGIRHHLTFECCKCPSIYKINSICVLLYPLFFTLWNSFPS